MDNISIIHNLFKMHLLLYELYYFRFVKVNNLLLSIKKIVFGHKFNHYVDNLPFCLQKIIFDKIIY